MTGSIGRVSSSEKLAGVFVRCERAICISVCRVDQTKYGYATPRSRSLSTSAHGRTAKRGANKPDSAKNNGMWNDHIQASSTDGQPSCGTTELDTKPRNVWPTTTNVIPNPRVKS